MTTKKVSTGITILSVSKDGNQAQAHFAFRGETRTVHIKKTVDALGEAWGYKWGSTVYLCHQSGGATGEAEMFQLLEAAVAATLAAKKK